MIINVFLSYLITIQTESKNSLIISINDYLVNYNMLDLKWKINDPKGVF